MNFYNIHYFNILTLTATYKPHYTILYTPGLSLRPLIMAKQIYQCKEKKIITNR